MYKGASQNLQRATGTAFIMADEGDNLPDVEQMSHAEAVAEREQLKRELLRTEQEIAAAKAARKTRRAASAGQRKASICSRISIVNRRIQETRAVTDEDSFKQAVKEVCDETTLEAIYARQNEIREASKSGRG